MTGCDPTFPGIHIDWADGLCACHQPGQPGAAIPARDAVYADPATGVVRLHRRTPPGAHDYLTAQLVQTMAENAVMADVLSRFTHEFEPAEAAGTAPLCVDRRPANAAPCMRRAGHPVHSTPEAIRAQLGQAPEPPDGVDLAAVNQQLTPPTPDMLRQLRDGLARIGDQT